jgi:hypothetical protein
LQKGANRTLAEKSICPKKFLHEKQWMNQTSVRFAPSAIVLSLKPLALSEISLFIHDRVAIDLPEDRVDIAQGTDRQHRSND